MTPALQAAIDRVRALPPEEQDAIAERLQQQLDEDEQWAWTPELAALIEEGMQGEAVEATPEWWDALWKRAKEQVAARSRQAS